MKESKYTFIPARVDSQLTQEFLKAERRGRKSGKIALLMDDYPVVIFFKQSGAVRIKVPVDAVEIAEDIQAQLPNIIQVVEKDKVMVGNVVRIMAFGAFVQLANGQAGLLHISQMSETIINSVEEVLTLG